MPKLKKYKHDNKEGFNHSVKCPNCGKASLMDEGQFIGVETSICPYCNYKFHHVKQEV